MKKRILVVDDEVSITTLLKLNLEKNGRYEVMTINDGERALPAVKNFKPDVVLLDVMMPGTDGGTLAAKIKSDTDNQGVAVVFLTAAVRPQEVSLNGGMIGGLQYIAKPLDVKGVIEVIERQPCGRRD